MEQRKKFYVALSLYALIGLMIWMFIDNTEIFIPINRDEAVHTNLRQLTLAIWGLFVALTVIHWRLDQRRARREEEQDFKG